MRAKELTIDSIYVNFWGKPKAKFTELEIALMEGGHSIDKEPKMSFIKQLSKHVKQTPSSKR